MPELFTGQDGYSEHQARKEEQARDFKVRVWGSIALVAIIILSLCFANFWLPGPISDDPVITPTEISSSR